MQYVEYIQTDGYCWFDTGLYPSINTKIEVDIKTLDRSSLPSDQKSWGGIFGSQNENDANSTFQIRNYLTNNKFSARVGNGNGVNNGPTYALNTRYLLTLDMYYFSVDGTQYSTNTSSMETCNYTMFISAINNSETGSNWPNHRAVPNTFYGIKVWENNVLVGDFKPAVDNNNNVGFYDKVSQSFKANLGTGTPVAGPSLSSISVSASKNVIAASGETINIVVDCENAWTVSGNTWLTLSSTGDTGSTTITATAPSYSGATARTDVLTFTDTVTGDDDVVNIRQKKYTSGQPVYLGGNEITELYLGGNQINEAYLGDVLVFSASAPTPPPTSGGDITITIDGIDACIGGDPIMGDCLDVSAYTYSIVSIDPNDGTTELETFASATIENAMYGEGVRYEITDSATTSGITSITLDDSDGLDLLIEGSFNTANTYVVKCSSIGIDDGITRYGWAMSGNSNNNFDLSEDISVTPDFSNELMPLRTLTIEGVPALPGDATHIDVTDDDKFGIEIAWNGEEMDVDTYVWTGDCSEMGGIGEDCRITVNYVREEEAIIIEADWEPYDGEGSGEYTLRMKAETDSCTVEEGDEGTYSLQWSSNEMSKTITFDGGTCTPYE